MYSSITDLPQIGDCLVFKSLIDSKYFGLLLYGIDSNVEGTSYSFCIAGKVFESLPSSAKFLNAGLLGRKIATGGNMEAVFDGTFQKDPELYTVGFSIVSIDKVHLELMLPQFIEIETIPIARSNRVNASFLSALNLGELADACSNQIATLDIKPSYDYLAPIEIFPVSMILASDGQELQQPEESWVISKKSAHPLALELLLDDFYWDTVDEFAPFGSNEGFDTVYLLKSWLEENPKGTVEEFLNMRAVGWDMKLDYLEITDPEKITGFIDGVITKNSFDYVIIAAMFGELLIRGNMTQETQNIGKAAILRQLNENVLERTIGDQRFIEGRKDILLSHLVVLEKLEQFE